MMDERVASMTFDCCVAIQTMTSPQRFIRFEDV